MPAGGDPPPPAWCHLDDGSRHARAGRGQRDDEGGVHRVVAVDLEVAGVHAQGDGGLGRRVDDGYRSGERSPGHHRRHRGGIDRDAERRARPRRVRLHHQVAEAGPTPAGAKLTSMVAAFATSMVPSASATENVPPETGVSEDPVRSSFGRPRSAKRMERSTVVPTSTVTKSRTAQVASGVGSGEDGAPAGQSYASLGSAGASLVWEHENKTIDRPGARARVQIGTRASLRRTTFAAR